MDSLIVIRSNRIYKKDLDCSTVVLITDAINEYNSIKRYAHKTYVNELRYPEDKADKSLFFKVKDKYPETYTYILNSAINEAKAAHKSCDELVKDCRANTKERLNKTNKKQKKTIKYLQTLLDVKNACVEHSQSLDKAKVRFPKKQRTFKILPDGTIFVYKGKGKKRHIAYTFDNIVDFECQYLTPEIRRVKSRIGLLQSKINRCQSRIDLYNHKDYDTDYIKAVQFGSRKLRKQAQTDKKKKQKYNQQRNKIFTVSGRCDSKNGNFVFSYDTSLHLLTVKLKPGTQISLNASFPYGQNILTDYYAKQRYVISEHLKGSPITYSIEDLGDYYIVKCMVETESEVTNYNKSDGVIGIDTNLGFFSVCETNAAGQPILFNDYHYEWHKKSSNQIKNNICNMVKELITYADSTHKPIVIEDLKFKGNKKLSDYNDKKSKNFKSNMFAYHKTLEALKSAANKHHIEVYIVSPQYTSLIGKVKFMPYYKRSVHQMAALTIARRCLELSETIPKRYTYEDWKELYTQTK